MVCRSSQNPFNVVQQSELWTELVSDTTREAFVLGFNSPISTWIGQLRNPECGLDTEDGPFEVFSRYR